MEVGGSGDRDRPAAVQWLCSSLWGGTGRRRPDPREREEDTHCPDIILFVMQLQLEPGLQVM